MGERDLRSVRELMALRARLRELMEEAVLPHPPAAATSSFEFPVDVWESPTEVVVEAELPGATADGIELHLEGDRLVISGELPGAGGDTTTMLRIERYCGPFRRAIDLPPERYGTPVASLRAGVLQVRLPKQSARRRRIAVDAETP